ncbi:hypothetical protein AHAS_Ahas14G0221900 [Arachis hypogaea]
MDMLCSLLISTTHLFLTCASSKSLSFRQYENTFSLEVPPQVSHLANLLSLDLFSSMLYDGPIINNLQLEASTLKSLTQNSTRL